jgi:transcriptional regulator with XRE-family HTH domain
MKLDALHKRFSRDATYRRAYDELGGWVELGLRCRSLRERAGLSKTALAAKLSLSLHALTEFERGDERRPEIILHILNHWESALVAEGFDAASLLNKLPAAQKSPVPTPADGTSGARQIIAGLGDRIATPEGLAATQRDYNHRREQVKLGAP